jgi:hypothetical protein
MSLRLSATIILVTLLLETLVFGQESLERKSGETLKAFAKRVIPKDQALSFPVVTRTFGPAANSIVIIFHPADREGHDKLTESDSRYTGWALIPDKENSQTYRKWVFPPMGEPPVFDITVKAVFCAQADRDKELELFVLYKRIKVGPYDPYGNPVSYAVNVYDWNGKAFVEMDDVIFKLNGLKTEASVRRKLRSLKK